MAAIPAAVLVASAWFPTDAPPAAPSGAAAPKTALAPSTAPVRLLPTDPPIRVPESAPPASPTPQVRSTVTVPPPWMVPSPPAPSGGLAPAQRPTHGATSTASTGQPAKPGLDDPRLKEIAMKLISSAENSSLNWRAQYRYIEDIGDGRGYTAGIMGFCSGTGDMLALVELYTNRKLDNVLAKYLPALRRVDGSSSHSGLDPNFPGDWVTAAKDTAFQKAQNDLRDSMYFNPSVNRAKADGLRALGQFIYFDAMVMHGPGDGQVDFGGIRATAMRNARTPAQGGDEVTYLNAFLDARVAAMRREPAHSDTGRVDTEQRVFLDAGNLDLNTPLRWKVYGDSYTITG